MAPGDTSYRSSGTSRGRMSTPRSVPRRPFAAACSPNVATPSAPIPAPLTTSGTGAHAVIAQSIGGGGGIVGLPGTTPALTTTATSTQFQMAGYGNTVTVTSGATIAVSGAGATGILAQSIGGRPSLNFPPSFDSLDS